MNSNIDLYLNLHDEFEFKDDCCCDNCLFDAKNKKFENDLLNSVENCKTINKIEQDTFNKIDWQSVSQNCKAEELLDDKNKKELESNSVIDVIPDDMFDEIIENEKK